MKRLLLLTAIVSASAAYDETPIYPYDLGPVNETTLDEVDSWLSAEGWKIEVLDEGLSLYAVRENAEIIFYWIKETFLREVSYSEFTDDAWDAKEGYAEWMEWLTYEYGKPMIDDETFNYWKEPGEEIWIEITEAPDGLTTLIFNLTFL